MKAFLVLFVVFAVALAADPAVCQWCNTLVSQIEQLQTRFGRAAVESYIKELCSIATDEAAQVCKDWEAYGMSKIVDAIMAKQNSQVVCKACKSC